MNARKSREMRAECERRFGRQYPTAYYKSAKADYRSTPWNEKSVVVSVARVVRRVTA